MNYLLVLNRLIIISILFFPLQNLGLSFFGSRYDITSFILLFLTFVVSIENGKIKTSSYDVFKFVCCNVFWPKITMSPEAGNLAIGLMFSS